MCICCVCTILEQADLAGAVPPTSTWEIARTPVSSKPATDGRDIESKPPQQSSSQANISLAQHNKSTPEGNNDSQTKVKDKSSTSTSQSTEVKKPQSKKRGLIASKRELFMPSGVGGCAEDVPPPAKVEIPGTPLASQDQVPSNQGDHKSTQTQAASHTEVPVTAPDACQAVPPTSHWEIPRTPPTQLSVRSTSGFYPTATAVMTEDDRSNQAATTGSSTTVTSSLSSDHTPSLKRTPSFELAANIVKSIASKSPTVINNSSMKEIREALVSQSNVTSQGHPASSSNVGEAALAMGLTPPPKSQWEIPRTPVEVVSYENVQLSPSKHGFSRTPSRTKVPAHPLSVITSSTPNVNISPLDASKSTTSDAHEGQQPANTLLLKEGTCGSSGEFVCFCRVVFCFCFLFFFKIFFYVQYIPYAFINICRAIGTSRLAVYK